MLRATEVDLIGRAPGPGRMGSVAVVPEPEVGADSQKLSPAGDEPEVAADGFAEGAKDALDAAISPRVGRQGPNVADAVGEHEQFERFGAERWPAIGKEALGRTFAAEGVVEHADDLGGGGPGEEIKGDQSAAVVVDGGEEPGGNECSAHAKGSRYARARRRPFCDSRRAATDRLDPWFCRTPRCGRERASAGRDFVPGAKRHPKRNQGMRSSK